ncbi:DMT family transporter [Nocardioides sp. URHA0020]|uniref:DMT family transporter n=1 Tax=Nocardioides sp. URHA0020 TaxID=1380392 RepID=UPI00048BAA35|nr:DMT family transporter [Nocardioides sp. URHA0020]
MSAAALLLTLLAAVVHAGWNQLLAGSRDPQARIGIAMLVGAVATVPFAVVGLRWDSDVWPYVVLSVAFELAYVLGLSAAYRHAPMSVVYPVARGTAPVLVLLVAAVALGERVGAWAALGALVVVAGILLVRGLPRGSTDPAARRGVALALPVGACIAGYTLVDARGIEHASVAAYLLVTLGLTAAAQVLLASRQGGLRPLVADAFAPDEWWRTTLAGLGFFLAYGLVLLALREAPAGLVAAVRETSVVIAVLALAATGQEPLRARTLAGAVLVTGGVALVVLA